MLIVRRSALGGEYVVEESYRVGVVKGWYRDRQAIQFWDQDTKGLRTIALDDIADIR